ncbi:MULTISPECIES: beta-N-acetylglucosaminidase domain-containing protein [unclassified Nonomuraea]|uniref:beta-N-acetylglucosaminidase domain-containing protein n=1 Tax=unclassified Nonomuraea TaxID=2593643 RepID=UPI0033CD4D65
MALNRLLAGAIATTLSLPVIILTSSPAQATSATISPPAQQMESRDDGFSLPPVVGLVRTGQSDPSAEAVVRRTLAEAGVKRVRATDGADPGIPVTVWLGDGAAALDRLGVEDAAGLPAEGYVLAAGRDANGRKHVVLDGVDADGTYYAALTLRQLVRGHHRNGRVPGVEVRDWPGMRYRGSVEGFYGTPWSHEERLAHLDYLAAHKMNTYEYAPKDDPYHRERWREPYPPEKLAQLGELITRARAGHVDFTFAVSPGLSVCYSSQSDLAALLAKFDALHALGGRSFTIALDDIDSGRWNCDGDRAKYGAPGGAAAGRAQSELVNAAQAWAAAKGDVAPVQMVPTEYYNATETAYKKAIREVMSQDVIVHWTGTAVVPEKITKAQAAQARKVFGHQILVWDNYPVNDYAGGRLLLAPYDGREPGLSEHLAGVISNPMNQAAVSRIALYSFADFGWHDTAFNAEESWLRALTEAADGDESLVRALRDFADLNTFDGRLHRRQSPQLAAEVAAFWPAWREGRPTTLRRYAERLGAAAELIDNRLPDRAFVTEAASWLRAAGLWSKAMVKALDVLRAVRDDDGRAAVQAAARARELVAAAGAIRDTRVPHDTSAPRVGDGVLDRFVADALAELDRWMGVTATRPRATTSLGTYQANTPDRMVDGDPATFFWSSSSPGAGDHVTVDLGAPRTIGDIMLLMGKPGSPNDYIRAGALETSRDGVTWTRLATGTTAEIRATAPAGTVARYVRYRATAANSTWLVVREFTVQVSEDSLTTITVTGTPAGTGLDLAADGDLGTAYTAATAPARGDALDATLSRPRLLDRLLVVGTGSAHVQVRAGGQWRAIGRLSGPYTELDPQDAQIDAVRLAWAPGGEPPRIAEIVPVYADGPVAALTVDPAALDATKGVEATVSAVLTSQQAVDVAGTLRITGPEGWRLPGERQVTVPRGGVLALPVAFTPAASGTLRIEFAPGRGEPVAAEVTVTAHRPVGDTNVALKRPVTASTVEGGTSFAAANAVDGDRATRWSSARTDGEWLTVEAAQPVDVGKVTLRWEAAFGSAYRIEGSADGTTWQPLATVSSGDGGVDDLWIDEPNQTRFLRMQGVKRSTSFGYSLWELEVYPAS